MRHCLFFPLLFLLFPLAGQEYSLRGKVTDAEGQIIVVGDVLLLEEDSSTLVSFTYIEEGEFFLPDIKAGKYHVQLRALGYQNWQKTLLLQRDTQIAVTLSTSVATTEAITVTARRPSMINRNGNLLITVAGTTLEQQPTALEVMSQLPGVIVSPDRESIQLIGQGNPLLYLGNQRITIDELLALPVASILSIEIINNPSARYEADGRTVVLIKRKRQYTDGFRGNIAERASFQRLFNNYLSANASIKIRRLEGRVNVAYNELQPWEGSVSDIDASLVDIALRADSRSIGRRPQYITGGGLHYQLDTTSYLSANINRRWHTTSVPITSSSTFRKGNVTEQVATISDDDENRSFLTGNVNYSKEFPRTGASLFIGWQYSDYLRAVRSNISVNTNEQGFMLSQLRDQSYRIGAMVQRVDYEHPLSGQLRWSTGINLYLADADSEQLFEQLTTSEVLELQYDYQENNYAAYTEIAGNYSSWHFTAGLRSETTTVKGQFASESTPLIDRLQTVLFPRLNLHFTLDSAHSLNLNWAKNIRRPNYLSASSITTFLTPNFEFSRNANLVPSISQSIALAYQYGQHSIRVIGYRNTNPNDLYVDYDPETDRIVSSPQNYDLEQGLNLMWSTNFQRSRWQVNNMLMLSINAWRDDEAVVTPVRPFVYAYTNHRWTLPKDWTIGATIWGLTERRTGIFNLSELFIVGATVSKTIGSVNVALNLNDLLRGYAFTNSYTVNDIRTLEDRLADTRILSLNIAYNFGQQFNSRYRNQDVDETLNRMN